MTKTCGRCIHWEPRSQCGSFGECRRNAPLLVIDPMSTGCQTPTRAAWPETDAETGWCSEFEGHAPAEQVPPEPYCPPRCRTRTGRVNSAYCRPCQEEHARRDRVEAPLEPGEVCYRDGCGRIASDRDDEGRPECSLCQVPF